MATTLNFATNPIKRFYYLLLIVFITACANNSSLDVAQQLFGYIPPPERTSILEELQLEYDRCMRIGIEENCAQAAYDTVAKVRGLEPRIVPKGFVTILRENSSVKDDQQQESDTDTKADTDAGTQNDNSTQ